MVPDVLMRSVLVVNRGCGPHVKMSCPELESVVWEEERRSPEHPLISN